MNDRGSLSEMNHTITSPKPAVLLAILVVGPQLAAKGVKIDSVLTRRSRV